MIPVSEEWKNIHKQMLLPETHIRIQLEMIDDTVTELVTPQADNEAVFSNSDKIVNNKKPSSSDNCALLEHNFWPLDGSKTVVKSVSNLSPSGYVSNNDSESTLTLRISEAQTSDSPAFTITWSADYEEYPTDFTVKLKNGNTVVATTRVEGNNTVTSNVVLAACTYNAVDITVHEWCLATHRTRIDSVVFGYGQVFNKDQIMSYTHEQYGDPASSEISRNTIRFSLDNSDDKWNPLNPNGLEKYLYEQQKVVVHYGMEVYDRIEWFQAGVFYLSEWRVPSTGMEATFVAEDIFTLLTGNYSKKAIGKVQSKANVTVYAEAGGHVTGSGEKTTVSPGTVVEILENGSYSRIEGNTDPFSSNVDLLYRISSGWILQSLVNITSDRTLQGSVNEIMETMSPQVTPCHYGPKMNEGTIPVVVENVPAAQMVQTCANKCGYAHWQDSKGEVHFEFPSRALTDYVISKNISYSYPEVELTKPLKQIDIVTHCEHMETTITESYTIGSKGETLTIDNPYLWANTDFTDKVKQVYVDLWNPRTIVSGEFRADPRLELFDVVQIETKYGVVAPVMITSLTYTYNGSFHGNYTGRVVVESEEA